MLLRCGGGGECRGRTSREPTHIGKAGAIRFANGFWVQCPPGDENDRARRTRSNIALARLDRCYHQSVRVQRFQLGFSSAGVV